MDYRERVIRTVQFEEVDALPFRHAYGLMPGVLADWRAQGLPASVETEKDIYEHFGFPTRPKPLPVNIGFDPPFEPRVIEETDEYRIAVDWMGRTTKVIWESSTLPVAIDNPVKDAATWEDYKRRLQFTPERIGADLEQVAAENVAAGLANSIGALGAFWFPRDLMGDESLCVAYYEQPELVRDILDTWFDLVEQCLSAVLDRVQLDTVHFGEDMAYKTSSMVSKPLFDEFVRPYYQRIHSLIQERRVPAFSVDSDGCLNELAGWFQQCGVNLIGPNEVQAGNDILAYREQLGRTMAYDGGLEKQTLTQGRDAIDEMLQRTIPPMRESGGGWIVCLDHRVVRGTPLADFQYYVDRVREMTTF